jgi:16S rRNA (cytosine967-C5)-methyltransferase
MAAALSHPEWLLDRWLQAYGYEHTVDLCHHNNRAPHFNIRVNPGRARALEVLSELQENGTTLQQSQLLPHSFLQ